MKGGLSMDPMREKLCDECKIKCDEQKFQGGYCAKCSQLLAREE